MYTQWKEQIGTEVSFWDEWIATGGSEWKDEFKDRLRLDTVFADHLYAYIKDIENPAILDVGAGPLTYLGKRTPDGKDLNITPVDPLANHYNKLLDKAGIIPPVRTQFGEAERLSDYFEANTFDFVFMRNALDHSYNPMLALKQMIFVAKPSGHLYLTHSMNEAEKQEYDGLHQWNIGQEEDGNIVFWNKDERIRIMDVIGSYCELVSSIKNQNGWIDFSIKKLEHRDAI